MMLTTSPACPATRHRLHRHRPISHPRWTMWRLALAITVSVGTIACDGDDGAGVTGPEIGPPAQLAFITQPADAALEDPIPSPIQVAVQDSAGNTVQDAATSVTLTLESNPAAAGLGGTTTAQPVDGIATFDDLFIDETGTGYTLRASAAGLSGVVSEPFDVRFILASISAGTDHACGLTPGGATYCWGTNGHGQFGNGEAGADHAVPVPGGGELDFSTIGAGDFHTCGLTAVGEAYCWGWDSGGQRGDGQAGTRDTVLTPGPVIGGLTFVHLSTGEAHTCGISQTGTAYCWGNNGAGELGDGDAPIDKGEPTPVQGDLTFESLTAGSSHSCGITTAGAAYCWGSNSRGQLGDDNVGTDSDEPVAVMGGLTFTMLSASNGSNYTCGLTVDGAIYCWGINRDGALGDGNAGTDSDVPVPIMSDLSFQDLDAGSGHTCALSSEGAAYCWGENPQGQLGDGNEGTPSDMPVPVLGDLSFEGLSSVENLSCAWTSDGSAYCWGSNLAGKLGDGNLGIDSERPVRVVDPE